MIKVEGTKEALALLNEVKNGQWRKNIGEDFGRDLVAKTKTYPSKPPGSKYRRTMNLSRQWYSSASNDAINVGNRADYSGWVQQEATQAWFHRQHGWVTIETRFESAIMKGIFERLVQKEFARIFAKHGTV